MSYTDPVDPTPGSMISAANEISYIYDNIRYLFSGRPVAKNIVVPASAVSYTANTWGVLAAQFTKSNVTINSTHALVRCSFRPKLYAGGAGTQWGYFDLAIGSTRYGDSNLGLATISQTAGLNGENITLEALFEGITPGSYDFTIYAKYIQGTATAGGIRILEAANADASPVNMIIFEY